MQGLNRDQHFEKHGYKWTSRSTAVHALNDASLQRHAMDGNCKMQRCWFKSPQDLHRWQSIPSSPSFTSIHLRPRSCASTAFRFCITAFVCILNSLLSLELLKPIVSPQFFILISFPNDRSRRFQIAMVILYIHGSCC